MGNGDESFEPDKKHSRLNRGIGRFKGVASHLH